MGIDGLWPLANSLTGPTVCNVTNRLDTAAHFMYGVSAERSLPLPPPIPDPSTDPSNSVNRNPSPSDSQDIHTPSPVLPIASTSTAQYAPIASTSNLNRQPLHPPPPSSSLNLAAALPRRPSYVDRPIATVKPIYHFVFETAPFDENEKRSMLKNLKTSSQPLAKFIKQHQYQVTAVTIKIADEYGRSFPGSMFSFVFEGLSTIKKKKEAEARARKLVEGQQKGEWKAEQTVYVKARKEKKYEKRAEATARKRVEKRTGVKPTKEGQKSGEGEGEGEGVRAEGVEGGGRGMDVDEKSDVENSNSPQNASSDAPQRVQYHQVPRVRAPEVTNIPTKYLPRQFVNTPKTRIRNLQAHGEGERGLTPAARISTLDLAKEDLEHIEYVKYAPGADPASFPQPALYTVACSPDGDQVPLITETVFGFIMNEPNFGGIAFQRLAIEAPPDSPQHYDRPKNVTKRIKSFRVIITQDFFHDVRIFPLPTIECRASMPVYIGNDTAVGGYGIGWGTFTNGKHSELMELSSRPSLVEDYQAAPDKMEEEYLVLVRQLRQSQYIMDLKLSSFIDSRETNLGRNVDIWDKLQHVTDYIKSLKEEGNQKRAERQMRTQKQTERVGNEKSRRRNHPYFPNHKWPKAITQDGGGGSTNARNGGGGSTNARNGGGGSTNARNGGGGSTNARNGMEVDEEEIRGEKRGESEDRDEGEGSRAEEIVDEGIQQGGAGGGDGVEVDESDRRKSNGKGKEKAIEEDSGEQDVTFSQPLATEPESTPSSDQARDDNDEWEDEDPEEPIAPPLPPPPPPTQAPIGFQMPTKSTSWGYRRRSHPLFHSQTHRAKHNIQVANLPIPQEAPLDPPLLPFKPPKKKDGQKAKKVRLCDYGCPYVVRRRSVRSASRAICVRSRLTLNRKQQLELKDAFDRTDATILSTGVVTVAAVGRTVSQWFDVLVKEEPRNLSKLDFKGFDMQNLVRAVASMRAGVDVETGVVEVDETAESDTKAREKQLIRQACTEEERSSGQRFRSRDPASRLEVTLSNLVTNLNQVIPARLVGIKPFEYLLHSLLSSPETTLRGLDGFFKVLLNKHSKKECFSEATNGLSSESAAVWSRLHRNERVREPLIKLLVQFILSETSREYVKTLTDWTDDTLPQHLLNAIDTAFAQLSRRPVTLDSSSTNDAFTSQATLDDARDRLGVVLCLIKRFLPIAYLQMAAFTVPSKSEDEIRTALSDEDFLPVSSTIYALVTRTAASEPCKKYWEGTRGFKLAILAIAHSQKINYGPTSFNYDASTTHQYVKVPEKVAFKTGGKKLKNRPALIDVLRDHLNNAEKSIRRTEKAFAAAQHASHPPPSAPSTSATAPSSNPIPPTDQSSTSKQALPPLSIPDFVSDADAWINEDKSEDPVVIRSKSEYSPPRAFARYLHRQHRRGRELLKDHRTSTLADAFNELTFLSSVERIATLRYLAPELKFVESLAGNPHYKLTNQLDRYGYAIFIINDKLLRRDLRLTYQFYTTILPHQTPSTRDDALNALRHEVLPLRLHPAQEGNLVLQGYTRTPTSVNSLYIDPRRAKYAPVSYLPKAPNPTKSSRARAEKRNSRPMEEDPKKQDVKSKTFIDIVEYVVKDQYYNALQKDVIYESVKTHKRTKQGRIVYSQRLIAPFIDHKTKKWTKARELRRRKPAQLPSTVDPLKPLLLRPDYKDHDFPNRGLFNRPFRTDEEEDTSNQVAQQNLALAQYRLHGPLPPNVIRIICGTDAGQWILGAITWYCPESQECFLDMLKRNAFVGRDKTAQHVRDELSSDLKEKERDAQYRSINPKLEHEKEKDGALKSIAEYNKLHPTDPLSTNLAQPSQLVNVYNHERQSDHEREMRKIVAQQVSTAFPYVRGRTYQISFFLSCDKLPTTGVYGRNLYSTYERMLCEELHSREYIDLRVFMMPEAFTSSHCIYCDKSCVFHPESLETGQPLPRLTICRDCTKIHHRDALASQLFVQAAYLTTLTGIFSFSPAHEIDIYGRVIEPRLSDDERRRCRRTELELMTDFWARDCLRKQNNAFDPPADQATVEGERQDDRDAVRAAIEAPDDAEKLPKIRRKKVESLPEIARLQGDLSPADYRRMEAIAAQNPHLQAPTQYEESSD